MHREGINWWKILMGMSGTCLGAAYENMPYLCDKENERSDADIV